MSDNKDNDFYFPPHVNLGFIAAYFSAATLALLGISGLEQIIVSLVVGIAIAVIFYNRNS